MRRNSPPTAFRSSCRCTSAIAVAAALLSLNAGAETDSRVDEIIVTAPGDDRRVLQQAIELDREQIAERTPVTLTDIFKGLPSVGIRTNSRGEAVLRLRGSEERQTSIFLDGAPLSVPWDGRVDLSALPAGLIEEVRVTTSAAPLEYGTNSVLGVIDIRTPVATGTALRSVGVEVGTGGERSLGATATVAAGDAGFTLSASHYGRDGELLADPAVIPFDPVEGDTRDNTDLTGSSLFAAAQVERPWGAMRLSLLSVDAERGIAPAGHIDPEVGSPRYWRYPNWRFNQLTLNSGIALGSRTNLRSTVWYQLFGQTIDQYVDGTYQELDQSEKDDDRTIGMRLVLEHSFERVGARLVANAQTTTHDQVDTDGSSNVRGPLRTYRQDIGSLGIELDASPVDPLRLSFAVSYDMASTPKTGGHPAERDMSEWATSVALAWFAGKGWKVTGTVGQRTRFPSLRELYGEALGSFVVNPDLRPETALLSDVTFERISADRALRLRLTPWVIRIDDTLSRRFVDVDGERLRQRYNLKGSTGYGLEGGLAVQVNDRLDVRLTGNWQHLEGRMEEDGTRPVLYQRPRLQASLLLDYVLSPEWDVFLSIEHLDSAFDEHEDGRVLELPSSTEWNFRLFRTLKRAEAGQWRAYAAIDNATDEVVLPQLGLPLPGRTISLGLSFESFH